MIVPYENGLLFGTDGDARRKKVHHLGVAQAFCDP